MNFRTRSNTPTRFTLAEIEAQCKKAVLEAGLPKRQTPCPKGHSAVWQCTCK